MKNLKSVSIITDGKMKRALITYDVIDDSGDSKSLNKRVSKVVSDSNVLEAIDRLETFAQKIIDEQED